MSSRQPPPRLRPDWVSKSLAGTLLGFSLAVALSGIFAWAGPGGLLAANKYQLAMWLLAPLWLGVLSFCFLFRTGLRAWLWLGGANLAAYATLYACRSFLR